MRYINRPIAIGSRTAPSRIVYQPTETNNCDAKGCPTETTFRKYEQLARGGAGISHVESIDVTSETQARSHRMVMNSENLPAFQKLVARMRAVNPDTLIIFQLSHGGRLSDPQFKPPVAVYTRGDAVHLMTTGEVQQARDQFIEAAYLAYKAGADGIDFKQAHGFLADDFLHPANNREDQYGGSFENRIRFFRETYQGMRDRIPDPGFLIGSRISPFEGIAGGCGTIGRDGYKEDFTEMKEFVKIMEQMGIDFINVSAGYASATLDLLLPSDAYPEGVPRLFGWTRMIKETTGLPVIGSGYSYLRDGKNNVPIEDPDKKSLLYFAENNLEKGYVDLIGIGRQSIADPLFAGKVLEHRDQDVLWCTTCGGCTSLLGANKKIGCVVYDTDYMPAK